jgi:hypothetical protein
MKVVIIDQFIKVQVHFKKKKKIVCVHKCQQKLKAQRKVNDTEIFVDEVETQLREKPLRDSQTQEFHNSED